MTLKEIQNNLEELKNHGFILSHRKGPTGIGHTLEQELKLNETNLAIPDIGGRVELKASRKSSGSMVTLFTFNRGVWQVPLKEIIAKYGYIDDKRRQSLYSTVFHNIDNPQKLNIQIDRSNNKVHLYHNFEILLGTWSDYTIVGKFITKLERLIIVFADSKIDKSTRKEMFHFNEAYFLNEPSPENFINVFESGQIAIDLRMHLKENGTVRNHGTGFRISEKYIPNLYKTKKQIL